MAPVPALPIRALLEALLAAVVAEYGVLGADVPERRYIAPGGLDGVAWDCEQLTVGLVAITAGRPFTNPPVTRTHRQAGGHLLMRTAVIGVEIVRCTPSVDDELPTTAAVHASGLAMADEATRLAQAVTAAVQGLTLGTHAECVLGDINSTGPSGKYVGLNHRLSVVLG